LLLLVLWYRHAWVADDAFITFRSVEQLFAGNGPRWNPHERVQAFTHPLWFLGLVLTRVVSPALYYNVLVLGLLAAVAIFYLLQRYFAGRTGSMLVALALLFSSRAWFDYLWSGLENPLYSLLLVMLALLLHHGFAEGSTIAPSRTVFRTALVCGLLLLCRPDLLVLVLPVWGFVLARGAGRGIGRLARATLLGAAPFLAWTGFSVFYYGFPLPNTAYAKLLHGLPPAMQWQQGIHYLTNSLSWDPLTLVTAILGVSWALTRGGWRRWLAVGEIVHLLYVTSIGGDFMAGRFYGPLVVLSAIWVTEAATVARLRMLVTTVLLVAQLAIPGMPLPFWREQPAVYPWLDQAAHGIADEKGVYEPSSLRRVLSGTGLAVDRGRLRQTKVVVYPAIGRLGYSSSNDRIIIDPVGLSDPLLARLPAVPGSRVGHFTRELPAGYAEGLASGSMRSEETRLADYYRRLALVAGGPLFSLDRFRSILWLNTHDPRVHLWPYLARVEMADGRWSVVGSSEVGRVQSLQLGAGDGLDAVAVLDLYPRSLGGIPTVGLARRQFTDGWRVEYLAEESNRHRRRYRLALRYEETQTAAPCLGAREASGAFVPLSNQGAACDELRDAVLRSSRTP
jgi:arabinofuranosyltransferase